MADEELLRKKRTILRTAITNNINKLDREFKKQDDEVSASDLEETLEILENKFETLKTVDKDLEPHIKVEEFENEFLKSEEYAEKVQLCKFRCKKKLSELKRKLSGIPDSNHELPNPRTEINRTSNVSVNLPKLRLDKFYGDINNWLTFWNSFESSIHNNTELSKVDKFNYLKAYLGGTALCTIEGLSISDAAYDSAVNLLKERFGDRNLLIHNHTCNILNMKPLKNSNDVTEVRKFYDKILTELRSIEALGSDISNLSAVLCTAILKALPQNLLIDLNKPEHEKGYYDIKCLLDFLSGFLKSREKALLISGYGNTNNHRKNSPPETESKQHWFYDPDSDRQRETRYPKEKKKFAAADLIHVDKDIALRGECVFCGSNYHKSKECDEAKRLSIEERRSLLFKKGGCYKCLEIKKHIAKFCKKNIFCKYCDGKHASLMCFKYYQPNKEKSLAKDQEDSTLLINEHSDNKVYLQTLVARIKGRKNEHFVRVIFDTASSKSYVTSFVANKLNLECLGKVKITHGLFGGTEKTMLHNRYSINLKGLKENKNIEIEVMEQEKICTMVPKVDSINCFRELKEKNIFLSDICPRSKNCLYENDENEIHVLLGADVVGRLFTGKIKKLSCGLVAMQTVLGWTVMGKMESRDKDSSLTALSLYVNEAKITELWNLDSLGITDPAEKQSKQEIQELVLKHFKETVCRENDGRYKVCLPWIDGHPDILDNRDLAEKRLKNNVNSLKKAGLVGEYEQVFSEWESEGIIEKVKIEEDLAQNNNIHYLPHRAVIKPNSTTKIRPVFDGSAHVRGSVSINDCIEKGPNLIELIPSVLNHFRWGKVGVVADIRRAFLQISLNEGDRDYLRFLWWRDGNPENLVIYKHCRVVFGLCSSPFLLAATLSHHLDQAPDEVKHVALKLKESLYVDNCVASVDSLEELDYFRTEAQKLLASAKFDLRGWCYNHRADGGMIDLEREKKTPVLGLMWDMEKDTLSCDYGNFKLDEGSVTKRNILSLTHKIFDPIGFTCPVTLIPKLLLQKCWKIRASWDSKLPDEIVKEFKKWKNQILELKNISIPRRISDLDLSTGRLSLHVFCDASKVSYATCVFLRNEFHDQVSCQLIQARSRVAPLKEISTPRLELLACCIGTRLANTIIQDLKLDNIDVIYWSDSMDVLHWIKGEGPWGTFVENRVREIRKLTSPNSWNFISGHLNPADLPSRGCSVKTLVKSEWWLGPSWLLTAEENWPKSNVVPNMHIVNAEKRKTIVTATNLESNEDKFYLRYSSYTKIIRIVGWILRFYNNSKTDKTNRTMGLLNSTELRKAEVVLLKLVQREHFTDSSDPKLKYLRTISDSNGLLRVKTQIFWREDTHDFRLPIVLPSNHHVVEQLIMSKHRQLGHCGVQFLMSDLRENYWVLKCRKTVKRVINKCLICRKFAAKPLEVAESVLPVDRVRDASIFEIVGIDLAGPLYLKDETKTWILIITCAVFRAVHFELLSSTSTDNFILGFSRFIARRGRPAIVYCDQGTNFIGTRNLLCSIDVEKLKTVSKFTPIEWKVNPPASPWWGGFWERLIGILKRILRRVLGKSSLTYDEMITVICDCESIINGRPLTYVSEHSEELEPLTPAMFLQEISEIGIPELSALDNHSLNKRYLYRVKIRENLRTRFRSEYLGMLRQSLLKTKEFRSLKQGDVVLIWTDNSKRVNWPLGRIVEILPSRDNVARVAKVKTTTGILFRPIKKLCPLELNDSSTLRDAVTSSRGRIVRPPARLGVV